MRSNGLSRSRDATSNSAKWRTLCCWHVPAVGVLLAGPAYAQVPPDVSNNSISISLTADQCMDRGEVTAKALNATQYGRGRASVWMKRGEFTSVVICNIAGRAIFLSAGAGSPSDELEIFRNTFQAGTSTAPTAKTAQSSFTDAQLMARQSLSLKSWEHEPKCRFFALPKLELREASAKINIVASASYYLAPKEAPNSENTFETLLQDSPGDANWQGIYAQSGFHLRDPRYSGAHITRARLIIDGRDSGLPLTTEHSQSYPEPWSRTVSVEVDGGKADLLLTALAAGRSAVLELYSSGASPAFTWTYDLSTLRDVPRALRITRWRCS